MIRSARRLIVAMMLAASLVAQPTVSRATIPLAITDSFAPDYYYHGLVTHPFAGIVDHYSHHEITMPLKSSDPRG